MIPGAGVASARKRFIGILARRNAARCAEEPANQAFEH